MEGVLRIVSWETPKTVQQFLFNPELNYPEFFKKDKNLFWRFKPKQKIQSRFFVGGVYEINSLGLRDREFESNKKAEHQRIVCLGNSCTFGWKVKLEESYPKDLEKLLREYSSSVEVINAGITGYSTFQAKRFLESDIVGLSPDVVCISLGWNDLLPAALGIEDKNQKLPSQTVLDIQNFLSNFKVYLFFKSLFLQAGKSAKDGFDRGKFAFRVSPDDFRANLSEMVGFCNKIQAVPILLTTPMATGYIGKEAELLEKIRAYHNLYTEIVRIVALEENCLILDVDSIFATQTGFYEDIKQDYIHYNAQGHKKIAESLGKFILEQKLLE